MKSSALLTVVSSVPAAVATLTVYSVVSVIATMLPFLSTAMSVTSSLIPLKSPISVVAYVVVSTMYSVVALCA